VENKKNVHLSRRKSAQSGLPGGNLEAM